jgi:hypothetical protein
LQGKKRLKKGKQSEDLFSCSKAGMDNLDGFGIFSIASRWFVPPVLPEFFLIPEYTK